MRGVWGWRAKKKAGVKNTNQPPLLIFCQRYVEKGGCRWVGGRVADGRILAFPLAFKGPHRVGVCVSRVPPLPPGVPLPLGARDVLRMDPGPGHTFPSSGVWDSALSARGTGGGVGISGSNKLV